MSLADAMPPAASAPAPRAVAHIDPRLVELMQNWQAFLAGHGHDIGFDGTQPLAGHQGAALVAREQPQVAAPAGSVAALGAQNVQVNNAEGERKGDLFFKVKLGARTFHVYYDKTGRHVFEIKPKGASQKVDAPAAAAGQPGM